MKRIRRFFHRRVQRYHGELCHDCGRRYDTTIWRAPDDLWRLLTDRGYAGLLCPCCFSNRAWSRGLMLIWEPHCG